MDVINALTAEIVFGAVAALALIYALAQRSLASRARRSEVLVRVNRPRSRRHNG